MRGHTRSNLKGMKESADGENGVWRCFYQDKNGVKVEEDASIVILKYGIDKYHQGRIPFPG
ncbi:unnamed protein product, partial [Brassica oleracea var. botrytis]